MATATLLGQDTVSGADTALGTYSRWREFLHKASDCIA